MGLESDHYDSVASVAQYALFILQDEFGDAVHVLDPNKFELPVGSTKVTTEVAGVGPFSVLLVSSPLALGVTPSAEVFEFVARQGGRPGLASMIVVDAEESGLINVFVVHHIYGNCLDRSELLTSVANVAGQADDADEKFVARFGGQRYSDAIAG
ncbi:MAG: hypothetical protein KDC23_12440 [Actinobacteria bacterium]|nr:hypothetical protein [Actinomycetota bacterium]